MQPPQPATNPFRIERALDDDAFDALFALQTEYDAALPRDLKQYPSAAGAVRRFYGDPGAAFVCWFEGSPAGCVGVTRLDHSSDVIRGLYVKPALRKRGVARALVKAAIRFSRERGCERVLLDTDRTRLRAAHALYRSLGFSECAPYEEVAYATPTFMELRLR